MQYKDFSHASAAERQELRTRGGAETANKQGWLDKQKDKLKGDVLRDSLAAISVGIVDGTPCLDLCYQEDSSAEVDMNVVMTGDGRFVELQGTAEGEPFDADQMQALVGLATKGINELTVIQNSTIAEATA